MDLFQAMQISASGLTAQRIRMNILASNLANANTTKTPEGGPFRRKDVYFQTIGLSELSARSYPREAGRFEDELDRQLQGVQVSQVVRDARAPRLVYDPNHPDANKDGYIALPNITVISEMVSMMNSQRSFEAGVTAINAGKSMVNKALTIGR
ncbi:MAG: flagellar basal body rod protein FlgC [Candidatus Tectomicrobia bacterium RIFCSPLOWO2_12_FULL_69_37]|nr:MAG: flagellar basal body rod protein FlgC [Candidatus Tectomicrobia bacterium RIFCSPLOWO2_12_FULL_69_37]OGL64865.1 MAG: flagellar basal body rod protein FlgC [Candidatus Tectomicrobia bacterium RIFCSPLOWO2_02_FULL_70_19]